MRGYVSYHFGVFDCDRQVLLLDWFPVNTGELLLEKAKFLNDISIHEIINIYDYQLDKKLIEYARNEKL